MLLVVALRAVSVSLAEFSSGMSESDLPVSSSSAFSAASVLGSSVPRSLMSCLRTWSIPEMPLDIEERLPCTACMVLSMELTPV